jgi:uncharacterized protein involved in exopolysaccharide biosynthesis
MEEHMKSSHGSDKNEVDVARILMVLWDQRRWIGLSTLLATVIGIAYALLAEPIYTSRATISLKEAGKTNDASRIFSQLGGVGGAVAAQLGGGNTNIDKIEIILTGHDLAEDVILKNNLMPILFQKRWDARRSSWKAKDPKKIPTLREGIERLRKECLVVAPELKKNVIRVSINFRDPVIAKRMVDYYLRALNDKLRGEAIEDAETNRAYLEKQLLVTFDPIIKDKIQNMIAFEVEKAMLISSKSFDILERPIVPVDKIKPRRFRIVLISALIGFFLSALAVFAVRYVAVLRGSILEQRR